MNISYNDSRHILELEKVKPIQKLLLFALISHMNPGSKRIFPSYATLGKELGCDSRTILRNIKALGESGHLEIRKERRAGRECNTYVVPFSDGYAYKSEQNDPSVPKPAPKTKDPAEQKTKKNPDREECQKILDNIVYTTPIPSVFVDIAFQDIEMMNFVDARDKTITLKSLHSHIVRMWDHCKEKSFCTVLEWVWDVHWRNIHKGLYNDANGNIDIDKEQAALKELEFNYGLNWKNINEHDEMHAPWLGFKPEFHFYPDKYEKRKANKVKKPPEVKFDKYMRENLKELRAMVGQFYSIDTSTL